MEDNLIRKATSYKRQLYIEDNFIWMTTLLEVELLGSKHMEDVPLWETSSYGRGPPLEDDLLWKITSYGKQPPMEDDLLCKMTTCGRRSPMNDDFLCKMAS